MGLYARSDAGEFKNWRNPEGGAALGRLAAPLWRGKLLTGPVGHARRSRLAIQPKATPRGMAGF